MTAQPPVTSYETVHDYRLLEPIRPNQPERLGFQVTRHQILYILCLFISLLALAVGVCAFLYVYLNQSVSLVPGSFQNATVAVDTKGRIVSVVQGTPASIVAVAPAGTQAVPSGAPTSEQKQFPWSPRPQSTADTSAATSPPTDENVSQANSGTPDTQSVSVVEDFVKFQAVRFKTGMVETGWRYADSNATDPVYQWCYFRDLTEKTKGLQPSLDLGDEAGPEAIRAIGMTYTEYLEAQGKCQWFKGVKPGSVQPSRKSY